MNLPVKPTLEESARRNPGVDADRVQRMQAVVKQLQDRGVLKPAKYGVQPGLTAPRALTPAPHGLPTMNRVAPT
jgi:hypothetical protein